MGITSQRLLTKEELKKKLSIGYTLSQLFEFTAGEDCEIFRAKQFEPSDQICYIPDLDLNGLRRYVDCAVQEASTEGTDEGIDEIIGCCYSGTDFISLCEGDADIAKYLFGCCNWQHPSTELTCQIADEFIIECESCGTLFLSNDTNTCPKCSSPNAE